MLRKERIPLDIIVTRSSDFRWTAIVVVSVTWHDFDCNYANNEGNIIHGAGWVWNPWPYARSAAWRSLKEMGEGSSRSSVL